MTPPAPHCFHSSSHRRLSENAVPFFRETEWKLIWDGGQITQQPYCNWTADWCAHIPWEKKNKIKGVKEHFLMKVWRGEGESGKHTQVWDEVCKKRRKGKEQAVMSDGAGRWLKDAFPINSMMGGRGWRILKESIQKKKLRIKTHTSLTRDQSDSESDSHDRCVFFPPDTSRSSPPEFPTSWSCSHQACRRAVQRRGSLTY